MFMPATTAKHQGAHHAELTAKERAQNLAVSGVAAGTSLVFSGTAYVLWGPTGADAVHTWFTGSIVAGIMCILLSLVTYFSYMEQTEPKAYLHEALDLEPRDEWDRSRHRSSGAPDLIGPDANLR